MLGSRHRTRRKLIALALSLGAFSFARSQEGKAPEANPARPTVTNPATLPPVGYLQFEQGYLGSFSSPNTYSQHGVNQVTKIAVHPRVMLEVEAQPFALSVEEQGKPSSNDAGDVLAGAQLVLFTPPDPTEEAAEKDVHRHAYVRSALPTVAFAYLERVHAGTAGDIDLGGQARTALFLFSGHAPGIDVHYDVNVIASEQTDDSGARRAQFGQTFSVDRPIYGNSNLQFSLEVYHFTQPTVHATASGVLVPRANLVGVLLAPSYQLLPNLVVDGGFEHGLTSTSTRWQAFGGFTYLLPHRLWREAK